MSFDVIGFCQKYGIEHVTEGHKHTRPGWVQMECPFCVGNPGYHLGFSTEAGVWNCWRCGSKRLWDVLVALLGGNAQEASRALREYKGRPEPRLQRRKRAQELEIPSGLQPLTKRARRYLQERKFDPDLIASMWEVQSTSNIGRLRYRIFVPIIVEGHMVSWMCRDVTGKSGVKYLAQAEDKEIISNKETLYGMDQAGGTTCVVVEGVTDVWRLGPGAVATFGIKYTPKQVSTLIKNFRNFHILFDPDNQAVKQASALGRTLSMLGGKVKLWHLNTCDPGDLPQSAANDLMREVGAGGY